MKKTVVIPTDFSIESLNLAKALLSREHETTKLAVILLHGFKLSDSISDLLFFSKTSAIASLSNPSFEEACDIIRNKYASSIHSIRKDLFTGFNQSAFNQYLKANQVDDIYMPVPFHFKKINPKSFDILPYIQRCPLQPMKISWDNEARLPEKGNLAEVFYNSVTAG